MSNQVNDNIVILGDLKYDLLRDRPFNLKEGGGYGFLFRSEFCFRITQELEYLVFCRAMR